MAKAATLSESSNDIFPFGRVQVKVMPKRKTPSELRGEQLKQRSFEMPVNSEAATPIASNRLADEIINALKKPESLKIPKYIDTRVNDVFPVRKSSIRCRALYGQEKPKDPLMIDKTIMDFSTDLKKLPAACTNAGNRKDQYTCDKVEGSIIPETSPPSGRSNTEQAFQKVDRCSQNTFRSVAELSLGGERFSGPTRIDMDKALKGLVSREVPGPSGSTANLSGTFGDRSSISSQNTSSEFHIPGNKTPLDFTLKTTLRLVPSSSIKWCHRLISSGTFNATGEFASLCHCTGQNIGCKPQPSATADALFHKALHSWIYPQSSLPSSVVSAMCLSASRAEMDFMKKRQQNWEDSFRNLYYMLRKNTCGIFYVCASQFVVLFIGGSFTGMKTHSCNAYLSQSTHSLRSLLTEQDICFSMPLCCSEVEQATAADLVEFSEIEKRKLGQTVHLDSLSDVDNSPQSLLAFIGNENVHALFDFLVNYRFFLSTLTSSDVPVIYAPVPFQNASISIPEVKCKEIRRAEFVLSGSDTDETDHLPNSLSSAFCYSIEIRDDILPPWTISRICAAMGSQGTSFESSFTTEQKTLGLNVALDHICSKSDAIIAPDGGLNEGGIFCIPEAIITPQLRSACLSSLEYSNGSYTASVTPL